MSAAATDPVEARRQRGLAIAATCRITQKNGQWLVPSQTGNGAYRVNLEPNSPFVPLCTCPDFAERGQPCKHVFAVRFVLQRETHPDGSETVTQTIQVTKQTCAKRPTYRQNWPAYNKAQTTEKHRFQILLADLCRGVPEPSPRPGKGQQPLSLADMVFSIAFKVYSTVSGRRFACDLADAQERGHIAKAPHFNSVFNYLRLPELTPILRTLIAQSSLPLKSIETDFAVDSSGFTTSRFVRWFDVKYGQPKQEYDWVKCHLMCGVKTNVVTAVEIGERYAADCPQFAPMVKATAENFTLREVSADAAYASYDNMELVGSFGATPYIAFPTNTSARKGGLYATMFHFYSLHRDEFLSHYHKRSNVETTNAMIKAKFGDHLRSKTDTAMVNEALCKVLCHNVCCLIQSQYELGIVPVFWGKHTDEAPAEPVADATDIDQMMLMLSWV
jgi:transposase